MLHLVQTCPADLPAQIRKRFARRMQKDGTKSDGIDDDDDDIAMNDGTTDILGGAEQPDENEDEDEDAYVRIRFLSGCSSPPRRC